MAIEKKTKETNENIEALSSEEEKYISKETINQLFQKDYTNG